MSENDIIQNMTPEEIDIVTNHNSSPKSVMNAWCDAAKRTRKIEEINKGGLK